MSGRYMCPALGGIPAICREPALIVSVFTFIHYSCEYCSISVVNLNVVCRRCEMNFWNLINCTKTVASLQMLLIHLCICIGISNHVYAFAFDTHTHTFMYVCVYITLIHSSRLIEIINKHLECEFLLCRVLNRQNN